MSRYDCPGCGGVGVVEIHSAEGIRHSSCAECGGSGKRKITIDLKEYDRLTKAQCSHCGNRLIYESGCWHCIDPECENQRCG